MGRKLSNVEVFQVGKHKGRSWTRADLDSMVGNYALVNDRFIPPVVIGHEEYQPLTQEFAADLDQTITPELLNTGSPSLGQVINPRVETRDVAGEKLDTLVVDFDNVPDVVADVIDAGAYNRVSAEVYPTPPEGMEKVAGPILRRVALLGGQLPHIKTLSDLRDVLKGSASKYKTPRNVLALSESKQVVDDKGRLLAVFSEVVPASQPEAPRNAQTGMPATLNDDEMRAILANAGLNMSLIGVGIPSATLAEMTRFVRMVVEEKAMQAAQASQSPVNPEAEAEKPPEEISETENKPEAEAETPAEGETPPVDAATPASDAPAGDAVKKNDKVFAMSEVEALVEKAVAAKLAAVQNGADAAGREARRTSCQMFCEQLNREGRLPPVVIERGLVDLMTELDARTPVKFSDGEATVLDKLKVILSAIPTAFTEKLKNKAHPAAEEERQILQFCEENTKLLKATGRKPEFYVEAYRAARKDRPDLTADEFFKGQK